MSGFKFKPAGCASILAAVMLSTAFVAVGEETDQPREPIPQSKAEASGVFKVEVYDKIREFYPPHYKLICSIQVGSARKVLDLGGDSGCSNDKVEYFMIKNGKKAVVGFYDKPCSSDDLLNDDFYEYKIVTEPLNHNEYYDLFDGNTSAGIPGMVPFKSKYVNGLTGKVSCIIIDPEN